MLVLCVMMLMPQAARAEKLDKLPWMLMFTQRQTARENIGRGGYGQRTYPNTVRDDVDAEMAALIDAMYDRALPSVPKEAPKTGLARLDVGASISCTGTKWLSFLTVARVASDREQIYADVDARAYDMETGARLRLTDLFAEDSPAWAMLAEEARAQLTGYFGGQGLNREELNRVCTREALENAAFTLTPASLQLHYRAETLYQGRAQVLHVKIYTNALRSYMTEEAKAQTDNSAYKMIALTFDDGPARDYTYGVTDALRLYGAQATFFVVGQNIAANRDVLASTHDAGHLIASHNFVHTYENLTDSNLRRWHSSMNSAMVQAIGLRPTLLRAPGGHDYAFKNKGLNLPLVHWSLASCDPGSDDVEGIISRVVGGAEDGDIVLMHDINPNARRYAGRIAQRLRSAGYLCVTVDELYAAHGQTMRPDRVYYGRRDVAR